MLGSTKAEVTRISETVARAVFTESNLIAMLEIEIQSRLPETIHHHAQALLPNLSKLAVAGATPDVGEMRAAVEGVVRERLEADLPELINRTAAGLLPGLAASAMRDATPDVAKLREELVTGATTELAGAIRDQAAHVLAEVVGQATGEVRAAVAGGLEKQAEELLTELEYAVRREAGGLLPELAREAMAAVTPDLQQLHDELAGKAAVTVTETAREATHEAIPDVVARVFEEAVKQVRGAVRDEAGKAFEQYAPKLVTVVLPQGRKVELGADTHAVLPELLVALHARCHVLLVGPAGTGKSMLAKHAAGALGLDFHALSLGPTTPMSKVFGYYDAHGKYHYTPFRRAFEHGGVMLLDELDNGHPGLLAELNQALALGTCAFADRMVDAHEDFRLVATGNTYGTGGDRQYVGRQTLDSATLDRFVVMDVAIDESLEERIALRHAPSHPEAVDKLLADIRRLRELAETKKLPVIISPRASIDGAKLLEAGATVDQVFQWRVVRGLSDAHRKALGLD